MVEVEIIGDEEADRKLRQLGSALVDLRPFWRELIPIWGRWMWLHFRSEGGWGGAGWAPLSPGYAVENARRFPGRPILQATQQLMHASQAPRIAASPQSLTLTSSDRTVDWHQHGTDKMPARPIIPDSLPGSALAEIEDAAERYVDDLCRRIGL